MDRLIVLVVLTFVTINCRPHHGSNRHPEYAESGNHHEPYSLKQYIANLNVSSDDGQLYRIMQGMKKNGDTNQGDLHEGLNSHLSELRNENTNSNNAKHTVSEENNEKDNKYTFIDENRNEESKPVTLQNRIDDSDKMRATNNGNKEDPETTNDKFDQPETINDNANEQKRVKDTTGEIEAIINNVDKPNTEEKETFNDNTDHVINYNTDKQEIVNAKTDEPDTGKGHTEKLVIGSIAENADEKKTIEGRLDVTNTTNDKNDKPEAFEGNADKTASIIDDKPDETETFNSDQTNVKSIIEKEDTIADETESLKDNNGEPNTVRDEKGEAETIKNNTDEAKPIRDKHNHAETIRTDDLEPVKSNIDIPHTLADKTDESKTNKDIAEDSETINNKAEPNLPGEDGTNIKGDMARETDEKQNKGDNTPDMIAVKGTVNPEQINSESNIEKGDIRNQNGTLSNDKPIDNKNRIVSESKESLTTLKYLDTEHVITSAIEKNIHLKDATHSSDITQTTSSILDTEPNTLVTNTEQTELNNDEEKIDNHRDKESTVETQEENNNEKAHISGYLSENPSIIDTGVYNDEFQSEANKNDQTADENMDMEKTKGKEFTSQNTISSYNVTELGNQVITTKAITVASTSETDSQTDLNIVTDKIPNNNEDTVSSSESNGLINVDDTNDQVSGRVNTNTDATAEIITDNNVHATDKESQLVHPISNTAPNSVNSDSTRTDVAVVKDTTTSDLKQKHLNDKPLSFHSSEEQSKQQSTKQAQVPVPTEKLIPIINRVETPRHDEYVPDGYMEGIEDDVDGEVKPTDDKPCRCMGDSEQLYPASALIASTVGGVFIGVFVVLLLFNARDKCKRYVNGDYRRVPMEYDFELNPRLKTH